MIIRLFGLSVLAGCGAGLVASLLQLWFVQPVILQAELFESGVLYHYGADGPGLAVFEPGGFDPARDLLSIFFTVLIYTGWALILLPIMAFAEGRGADINPRTGLIWGCAGFVVASLAPAFSAPPGLPGVATIDIQIRQIWWLATVLSTGTALWLLAFMRHPASLAAAVMLLLAPHAIGLPKPDYFLGPAPPELGALMVARVLGVGLAAWAILGAFAGYLWERDAQRAATQPT